MIDRRHLIRDASCWAMALGVGLALPTMESEAQPRGPPGTVIGVGGEEARDGGLAGVPNPGVIAGGPQAAASVVTGGNDVFGCRAAALQSALMSSSLTLLSY